MSEWYDKEDMDIQTVLTQRGESGCSTVVGYIVPKQDIKELEQRRRHAAMLNPVSANYGVAAAVACLGIIGMLPKLATIAVLGVCIVVGMVLELPGKWV